MSWFERIIPPKIKSAEAKPPNKRGVPEGLWRKCDGCGAVLYQTELEKKEGGWKFCLTARKR